MGAFLEAAPGDKQGHRCEGKVDGEREELAPSDVETDRKHHDGHESDSRQGRQHGLHPSEGR